MSRNPEKTPMEEDPERMKMAQDPGKRLYEATIWPKGSDGPKKKIPVYAPDAGEALEQLISEFGINYNFYLYNEEESNRMR